MRWLAVWRLPVAALVVHGICWAQTVLINQTYRVPPLNHAAATVVFERQHVGSHIDVSVSVAEHDINFFVCDKANYKRWASGEKCTTIHNCGRCTRSLFSFTVDKPGTVYFVMDNSYSLLTSKDVSLWVMFTASPDEIKDDRNDVNKRLSVETEYVPEPDTAPCIRGRDYIGKVKVRRIPLSAERGRTDPVLLDVDGDGEEDTVLVRFQQVWWVVDVKTRGQRGTFGLPLAFQDAPEDFSDFDEDPGTWVDLAACYLVSEDKPVLVVNTQRGVYGDALGVYDISRTAKGVRIETLLEAYDGCFGSPVVLKPCRIEIIHVSHPEMLLNGYTWAGDHFVSDNAVESVK